MNKNQEYLDFLSTVDPYGDFDGLVPTPNSHFDGSIHSLLELSTGNVYMSQGETQSENGPVVAIDRQGRYEELQPSEYAVLEVLVWDEETDELEVAPYKEGE